jgi:hypothetical protein
LGFEVGSSGPFVGIPMDVDKVDMTTGTGSQKVLKPGQTVGSTCVGNSRGS